MIPDPLQATLADAARGGAGLLLLSDYDGTLTPIVNHPRAAVLDAGVRSTLARLAGAPRVAVGLLSGRALDDLRGRVQVSGIVYAGSHGLDVEGAGLAFRHPGATALGPRLAELAEALRGRLESLPGVWVEPKGLTVAIHYREASDRVVPTLRRVVRAAVSAAGLPIEILPGKRVLELRPAVGWTKGDCALWLRDALAPRVVGRWVVTLYLGDDATDEQVFAALKGQGLTVRVGGRRIQADFRLRGVPEVHRLLGRLLEWFGEGRERERDGENGPATTATERRRG